MTRTKSQKKNAAVNKTVAKVIRRDVENSIKSRSKPRPVIAVQVRKRPVKPILMEPQLRPIASNIRQSLGGRTPDEENIAMSICMPGVGPSCRYPDGISSKKTAIGSTFEIIPCAFGNSALVSGRSLLPNESMIALFRNPLRAAVIYDQNLNSATYNYTSSPSMSLASGVTQYWPVVPFLSSVGSWNPHGNILFSATLGGGATNNPAGPGTFYWMDAGAVMTMQFNNTGAATYSMTGTVFAYQATTGYTNQAALIPVTTLPAGGSGSLIYTAPVPGYYLIQANFPGGASPTGATFTFTQLAVTGSGSVFRHLCMRDLVQNAAACKQLRIIGLSAMFSNYATNLNLGGQACGLQSGGEDDWLNFIPTSNTASVMTNIQSSADSVLLNASKGFYGFMKPMDDTDFDYIDMYETSATGAIVDSSYCLDSSTGFMMIAVAVPTGVSASGTFTLRYNFEYMTTDTWRDLDISYVPVDKASKALELVRYVRQFHENPTHIREIGAQILSGLRWVGNKIRSGVAWTVDNAPDIASKILTAGKIAAQVLPMIPL